MAVAFRIYKGANRQRKQTLIVVEKDRVVAARPEAAFMITWTMDHVRQQAKKYGYDVIQNAITPTQGVIHERPTPEQRQAARNQAA